MSATEDVSFEIPLETGSSEPPRALAELDIEAALKAGTLTEAQAIVQMERKMQAQVDAKIAELEERLGGGGQAAPATEVAMRSLIAHLIDENTLTSRSYLAGYRAAIFRRFHQSF